MFWNIVGLSIKTHLRHGGDVLVVNGAYLVTVLLYAYGFSPKPDVLAEIAPAIIWVNLMLSTLQALPSLYSEDAREGVLEQWVLLPAPLEKLVAAKLLGYWLSVMLPALCFTPLLALFLSYPLDQLLALVLALALGSLSFAALGGLAAAAILGQLVRSSVLVLQVLPFYLPILLFGLNASAAENAKDTWLMLLGMGLFLLPVSIFLSALLIRRQ